MIHYNVWFDLRNRSEESEGLGVISAFLRDLLASGLIAGFRMLKNSGPPPKSRMLPFQAQIEFSDGSQFSRAFAEQAKRGIHTGFHGRVMSVVSDFQIEVFEEILMPEREWDPHLSACEI